MNSKVYKSYEIGKYKYLELKYFCLQYNDFVKSNLHRDAEPIDDAFRLTTDNEIILAYLKRSVTENIPYERLNVPMGRRQFYALRRKFFYTLKNLKDNSP